MRFEILGPLAVWDGDRSVRVGGPREQRLLTALLLNANRTVSVARRSTSGLVVHSWVRPPSRLPLTSEKNSGCSAKWSFGFRMASKVWTNGP